MLVKSKDEMNRSCLKVNRLAGLKDNVSNLPPLEYIRVGTPAAHFFFRGTRYPAEADLPLLDREPRRFSAAVLMGQCLGATLCKQSPVLIISPSIPLCDRGAASLGCCALQDRVSNAAKQLTILPHKEA